MLGGYCRNIYYGEEYEVLVLTSPKEIRTPFELLKIPNAPRNISPSNRWVATGSSIVCSRVLPSASTVPCCIHMALLLTRSTKQGLPMEVHSSSKPRIYEPTRLILSYNKPRNIIRSFSIANTPIHYPSRGETQQPDWVGTVYGIQSTDAHKLTAVIYKCPAARVPTIDSNDSYCTLSDFSR